MQEFGFFTENVHTIAKCEKEECKIKIFLDASKKMSLIKNYHMIKEENSLLNIAWKMS